MEQGWYASGIGDWWTENQLAVARYQADNGTFITFPAYEWHGHQCQDDEELCPTGGAVPDQGTAPLHRVVLFRNHDAEQGLAMLPGSTANRPPQCLARFHERLGFRPTEPHDSEEALIIPHIMDPSPTNIDWLWTYAHPTALRIADLETMQDFQRSGEVFSARSTGLEDFETGVDDDSMPGAFASWAYRFGWKLGAEIGLIGSSDNHQQMPGVDDVMDVDGRVYRGNEPTGSAVVLAADRTRDDVFDALYDRATYATSGPRVWLDFRMQTDDDRSWRMGHAEPVSRCTGVTADVEVMAGLRIVEADIWAAPVDLTDVDWGNIDLEDLDWAELYDEYAYIRAAHLEPDSERLIATGLEVVAPAQDGDWLYYVRAKLQPAEVSATGLQATDAVWSSPIWLRWQPCDE